MLVEQAFRERVSFRYSAQMTGWTLSAFIAALSLHSAGSKLADSRNFRAILREYSALPNSPLLATLVPLTEIAIGLLVLSQNLWLCRLGLLGFAAFLVMVTGVISIRAFRGERKFRCGCSGDLNREHDARLLITRNLALFLCTGAAWAWIAEPAEGWPAALSGVGLFAITQLLTAAWTAREAVNEWKAIG